jgi:hypothetical protein
MEYFLYHRRNDGNSVLLLRISVSESGIYKNIEHKNVSKGNFLSFFTNKDRLIRYLKCIAVGLPTWYCIGILAVLANQFAPELGIKDLNPGKAIMWAYVGISVGDLMSGFISHALKSRKMAIFYMLIFTLSELPSCCSEIPIQKQNIICLCMAGLWNRVLGHVCNPGSRTVWNQYQKYSNDNSSQYGSRISSCHDFCF